jgi:hypothetical protein
VRFLGPLLPQAGVLGRLLQGLGSKGFSPVADGPAEALLRRIVASRA